MKKIDYNATPHILPDTGKREGNQAKLNNMDIEARCLIDCFKVLE